jgi:DNA-binding SARP family transcriptional activator
VTLRIKLLGSFELEREPGHPLRFPSRKCGELLAYLAINRGVTHAREHLAGVFWTDSTAERARHALNTTLWRVNRVLDSPCAPACDRGYLRVGSQTVAFNGASVWLDVAEFESRCELAEKEETPALRATLCSQAISFYRGDLLPDCYEDWCLVERERLQGLYLRALARLMAYSTEQGRYEAAIECGRRILGCDALREEVHRDLMRLHLRAGQPAAALRQYRQCEDLLREELAVEPAPETRALIAPILGAVLSDDAPVQLTVVTHGDMAAMAAKVRELSIACDAARTQLLVAMALLSDVTTELQPDRRAATLRPVSRAAGVKA